MRFFIDAYELGSQQAKEYDENPDLLFLNSVDDKTVDRENGKKERWQGVYALPSRDHHMNGVIEGGN